MKRKFSLVLITTVSVLFGVGLILGRNYASNLLTVLAQPAMPDAKQLQEDLAKENWTFNPVDPSHPETSGVTERILSRDEAIDAARKQLENSQPIPGITGVGASLGQLSKSLLSQSAQLGEKVDSTFTNPRLVWIVTFAGLRSRSAGPPDMAPKEANELNVVIDAVTGEYLMSFVWTR